MAQIVAAALVSHGPLVTGRPEVSSRQCSGPDNRI